LYYNEKLAGESFKFSWFAGIVSLLVLLGSGYASYKIYVRYDVPVTVEGDKIGQIGGWLILVAIGITLSPLRIATNIFIPPDFFNSYLWSGLTNFDASSRSMLTALLMFFELVTNVFLLVFSILIIALFFHRRSILPRMIIIFYTIHLVYLILDNFFAINLQPDLFSSADKATAFSTIFGALFAYIIWVPYFLISKRVKRTFVEQSVNNKEENSVHVVQENLYGTSKKSKKWLLILAGIITVFIILMTRLSTMLDRKPQVLTQNLQTYPSEFDYPPPEKLTHRTPVSQSWKYAILKCLNRRENEIQLGIITVNEYTSALNVLDSLEQGVSFKELAIRQSMHPSNSEGGELGWFTISELDKRFQVALKNVSRGTHTGIINMQPE
jgi:hypothetical protein